MLGVIMHHMYMYTFVMDHYQYLACIGPIALAAAGMEIGLGRIAAGKHFLQPGLCAALLMALGALTWKQCGMYADTETLWQTAFRRNPRSFLAQGNLGAAAFKDGQLDEAIAHYQKALEINPNFAGIHYDLGLAFFQLGRMDEAIAQYKKEIEINPDYALAHNNLGLALVRKGEVDEAIAEYQKALAIEPDMAGTHDNLATALLQKGEVKQAIAQFQRILEIKPDEVQTCNNLAWLLATSPEASLRDGNKAVQLARQANELAGGNNPVILATVAAAFAEAGRFSEAVETAQRALRLAEEQSNTGLAGQLQVEMKLYQAGKPFHSPAQTH
jgi:tetratricopeptide (TPR) repeat protein